MLLATQFDYQTLTESTHCLWPAGDYRFDAAGCLCFSQRERAHRWIKLKGFSIQPSEAAKLALAISWLTFWKSAPGKRIFLANLHAVFACIGVLRG